MPVLFLYLAKVSISLAAVYLFYRLLLKQLTFYNSNRWYLLGYTLLSFFIPLINISGAITRANLNGYRVVELIPVVNNLSATHKVLPLTSSLTLNGWDYLLIVLGVGMLIMLTRLLIQVSSFHKLKRNARLVSDDDINLYSIDKNIVPFSFGHSVFINPALHHQMELNDILHHEYVHVRQLHTIDIVFAEVLCLLNWYNPVAWLLRYSIRQNLEFIADSKVLEKGVEKKQYQYLLLKVMGVPHLHIGASFNLSSIKTRIIMMNKLKTTKVHMIKFLFLLPLIAVLLVAFRMAAKKEKTNSQNSSITISGLVMRSDNYKALGSVRFVDSISKIEGRTDENGFYKLTIPVGHFPYDMILTFSKDGYKNMRSKMQLASARGLSTSIDLQFTGMTLDKAEQKAKGFTSHKTLIVGNNESPTYEMIRKEFNPYLHQKITAEFAEFAKVWAGSQQPYWVYNGHTYLVNAPGGMAEVDTITNIIFVYGQKMTGSEVNAKFTRSMINIIGAVDREAALTKYGVNQAVMEILADEIIESKSKPAK